MTAVSPAFETLNVRTDGGVLFAEIAAPPMNLLGPELVRDLVSLIQRAEADDACQVLVFTSADPEYFISHVDVTRISAHLRRHVHRDFGGEAPISCQWRSVGEDHSGGSTPRLTCLNRSRSIAHSARDRAGFRRRPGEPGDD